MTQKQLLSKAKKTEYHNREHEGQELVVNSYGSSIGLSQNGVIVKSQGRVIYKNPVNRLRHLTITGQGISLSSNLISYCCENNIPIDFFSGGVHSGTLLSNRLIQNSLWNIQRTCLKQRRDHLARMIILGKLKNQLNLLKYFHKYHKSRNNDLESCLENMIRFLKPLNEKIRHDKAFPDSISLLTSIESQGALKYWDYIRKLLSDDNTRFIRRERKGASDLVNSMLNYGYAILYSRVWQAILKARLNPFDSIIHVPQPGKPTFVYDVIEIFRPQAVDRVVISLIQKRVRLFSQEGALDDDTRALLSEAIVERLGRFEIYRGERKTLDNIIRCQAKEIATFFSGEITSFKPYISKW